MAAKVTGTISNQVATDALSANNVSLTPKFKVISAAANGDNTIVAAVTGKKIRVLSLMLAGVGAAVNAYFTSGLAGTAICFDGTNPLPIDKTGAAGHPSLGAGFNPVGHFETAAGAALVLNLSGAQAVGGSLVYVEVA